MESIWTQPVRCKQVKFSPNPPIGVRWSGNLITFYWIFSLRLIISIVSWNTPCGPVPLLTLLLLTRYSSKEHPRYRGQKFVRPGPPLNPAPSTGFKVSSVWRCVTHSARCWCNAHKYYLNPIFFLQTMGVK